MYFRSCDLQEFIFEIQFKNRNPKNLRVIEMLDDIMSNPERVLHSGEYLYRSRIVLDESQTNLSPNFFGYNSKDSFVPPIQYTRDFRANYRYIPYLYCSNHPYTALLEVRPRLGALVSVATLELNENIRLLDFTMKQITHQMSEDKQKLFSDLSELYSQPVANDDDILDYIPTQYIAEYAKNLGYDGISFKSSLTPDLNKQDIVLYPDLDRYNIVVFNYYKCKPVKSNKYLISGAYIDCAHADDDKHPLVINPHHFDFRY